jgi:XTP/dITP diphosphohydrolase
VRPAVLVATSNPGKLREITRLLAPAGVEILTLPERVLRSPYEETGATYEANARGKAVHYAALAGMVAVADDSGIEVQALGGAPGPRSARYGGTGLDDTGRCRLLLREMEGVPEDRRGARYVAVAALARPEGTARLFQGVCEGRIARAPRGAGGFGYDPLFYYPPFEATFGEVTEARKDQVSHRGLAFRELASFLGTEEGRRFLTRG